MMTSLTCRRLNTFNEVCLWGGGVKKQATLSCASGQDYIGFNDNILQSSHD